MKTVIIIPARYQSTRFLGKPLASILGHPLIEWTYQAAIKASQQFQDAKIYVATDDKRIQKAVQAFDGKVIMTSEHHHNGTERVYEAAYGLQSSYDCIVNFQGDSPMITQSMVYACVDAVKQGSSVATPMTTFTKSTQQQFKTDIAHGTIGGTSVVCDVNHHALYFSKNLLPYGKTGDFYHHMGLYAYTMEALKNYVVWPQGDLEIREGLEQLRFLEHGWKIKMVNVSLKHPIWEVNNPNDVDIVSTYLNHKQYNLENR